MEGALSANAKNSLLVWTGGVIRQQCRNQKVASFWNHSTLRNVSYIKIIGISHTFELHFWNFIFLIFYIDFVDIKFPTVFVVRLRPPLNVNRHDIVVGVNRQPQCK